MNHQGNAYPAVNILGVEVSPIGVEELHAYLCNVIREDDKKLILNVNAHCLNLTFKFQWLREFLNNADLVFVDGAGVILGGKFLGARLPGRITYADWIWQLAEFSVLKDFSFFFLGAKPGVAEKAADNLRSTYPDLRVEGVHHGYFDKHRGSKENEWVLEQINQAEPNILIVGFGMPLQERWLKENWRFINANIALTGGAVFDYVSEEVERAPRWMTENGLEWLGRLMIEPRRLWQRYLLGNPLFMWRIIKQRFGILNI